MGKKTYFNSSSMFHPEIFLGDDEVFNSSSSVCVDCVGLRPYVYRNEQKNYYLNNTTVNRVRRQGILSDLLPPHDGALDNNSNYTGFIEIVGKFITAYFNQQCNNSVYSSE